MAFGIFEAALSSEQEVGLARQAAADNLNAAIYDVREKLGPALFASTSIEEFRDRVAMMKNDQSLFKIIGAHLSPVTGVVRRVSKTLEREFREYLAVSHESPWGSPEGVASGKLIGDPHRPYIPPHMQKIPGEPGDPRHEQKWLSETRAHAAALQATGLFAEACWPGCHENEAHAKKFHNKDKESSRRYAEGVGNAGSADAAEDYLGGSLMGGGTLDPGGNAATADNPQAHNASLYYAELDAPDARIPLGGGGAPPSIPMGPGPQTTAGEPAVGGGQVSGPTTPPIVKPGSRRRAYDDDYGPPESLQYDPDTHPVDREKYPDVKNPMPSKHHHGDYDGPVKTKSTYKPSHDDLIPEKNWDSYRNRVDQSSSKVERNFTEAGPFAEHNEPPLKFATVLYTDWCEAKGLSPVRLSSLDAYADNLSDGQYMRLAAQIQAWEYSHSPKTPKGQSKSKLRDVTAADATPTPGPAGGLGTTLNQGGGFPSGAPGENTINPNPEQTPGEASGVQYTGSRYGDNDGGSNPTSSGTPFDMSGYTPGGPAPMDQGALMGNPQVLGSRRDPLVAYNRWCDANNLKKISARNVAYFAGNDVALCYHLAARVKNAITTACRRYAAEHRVEDFQGPLSLGDVPDDGIARNPYTGDTETGRFTGDPSGHGHWDPNDRTHFSASRRTAQPDYLQKANEALTQLLNQKAQEFQETIAPLQQAQQTVQQAQQIQLQQSPLNVLPPAGTTNVVPGQSQTPASVGMPDPNAQDTAGLAALLSGGGGAPPGAAGLGAAPDGGTPDDQAGPPPAAAGGGLPPGIDPQMQKGGRRLKKDKGATRPRQGSSVFDLWKQWQNQNTGIGGENDYQNFAQAMGVGQQGINKLRTHHQQQADLTHLGRYLRWCNRHQLLAGIKANLNWYASHVGPSERRRLARALRAESKVPNVAEEASKNSFRQMDSAMTANGYKFDKIQGHWTKPGAMPIKNHWPVTAGRHDYIEGDPNQVFAPARGHGWEHSSGPSGPPYERPQPTPGQHEGWARLARRLNVRQGRAAGIREWHQDNKRNKAIGDWYDSGLSAEDFLRQNPQHMPLFHTEGPIPTPTTRGTDPLQKGGGQHSREHYMGPQGPGPGRHETPEHHAPDTHQVGMGDDEYNAYMSEDVPYSGGRHETFSWDRGDGDEHAGGGGFQGQPLSERGGRRKQAWSGWGPAVFPRARQVTGWNWDNHLNGYLANRPQDFSCHCGSTFPAPTGFHRCGCGRQWNSYVIGTAGTNKEASAEKFLVREIPVRHDVIVANRQMAKDMRPVQWHTHMPEHALEDYDPELGAEDEYGEHGEHLGASGYTSEGHGHVEMGIGHASEPGYVHPHVEHHYKIHPGETIGEYYQRTGAAPIDLDSLWIPPEQSHPMESIDEHHQHTGAVPEYGFPDEEAEDLWPSDHHPETGNSLKSTPPDWHHRDRNQRWTAGVSR